MNEKPNVVQAVLGDLVLRVEIPDSTNYSQDDLYAYPGGYGSPWQVGDDINTEYRTKTPYYPTNSCCQVKLESDGDLFKVVKARQVDTGNPEDIWGEWFEL